MMMCAVVRQEVQQCCLTVMHSFRVNESEAGKSIFSYLFLDHY